MTVRLGINDILEYNPEFHVLICRECQYAIQTSAISSHLLRHKIYRGDRQTLLASIAELHLLEPDDVPLPGPASSPVQSLPVISGYCCASPGCGSLCASTKRMRRHWSDAHDLAESSSITSAALARPAALQTFFRGTKLKYFEVTPVSASDHGDTNMTFDDAESSNQANDDASSSDGIENSRSEACQGDGIEPLCSLQQLSRLTATCTPFGHESDTETPLDLVAMRYFHHFTIVTSCTALPVVHGAQDGRRFWQEHVVKQALQWPWLMYGVLAISAAHSVSLETQMLVVQDHLERWNHYMETFFHRHRSILTRHEKEVSKDALITGNIIEALLRCLRHVIDASTQVSSSVRDGSLCQFLALMNAIKDIFSKSENHAGPMLSDVAQSGHNEGPTRAEDHMSANIATRFLSSQSSLSNTDSRVLQVLHLLPSRMAVILGRPHDIADVSVTLSAINSLIECCEISFSSDEFNIVWQGMTRWLVNLPDHFGSLLSRHEPAALVVVAYWATFLVRRVELCGGWFLKGVGKLIVTDIMEQFPQSESALTELVQSPFGTS